MKKSCGSFSMRIAAVVVDKAVFVPHVTRTLAVVKLAVRQEGSTKRVHGTLSMSVAAVVVEGLRDLVEVALVLAGIELAHACSAEVGASWKRLRDR